METGGLLLLLLQANGWSIQLSAEFIVIELW